MPAPLAKGLIIAASVLVAAGIAIYENPQVRQWVDQSRRKIAVALHSLGDDIQPRRQSESSDDFEERKRRREELIRRNRNELIRRAREEGIAVDLDELARIGTEDAALAERRSRANRSKSFDELVGSDGMLRQDATATGAEPSNNGVRKRGVAGFAAGAAAAVAMTNPFADENVLFDVGDDDEAPSPKPFIYEEPAPRSRSATLEAGTPPIEAPAEAPFSAPLIDLTSESQSVYLHPETQLPSPAAPLQASETDQAAQSFYSFTSSNDGDDDFEQMSAGTLTPRSERSGTTGASIVPSHADDVAVLSMQNDADHDARSEVFSEGGFTDAGYSDFELGDRTGVMTPNSWTDVGSDNESEWGGPQGNGHVSQIHQ
ncbi:hypothetical protein N0V87_008943 [Didymella glomerata]|uniref:Uncharacterized protein n=1 Tax=Didymella glomerata TaxID=749621 RepID=A0A9W8WS41_9PLEO|nr:hypothetical protein N0V87_008943 [Didymella glomerata]